MDDADLARQIIFYRAGVIRWLGRKYAISDSNAEDFVQDAIAYLWEKRMSLQYLNVEALLKTGARFFILAEFQRTRRRPMAIIEDAEEEFLAEDPRQENQVFAGQVLDKIIGLSPAHSRALLHIFQHGWDKDANGPAAKRARAALRMATLPPEIAVKTRRRISDQERAFIMADPRTSRQLAREIGMSAETIRKIRSKSKIVGLSALVTAP